MIYRIGNTGDGRLFDARIELDGSAVILHSCGGATGGRPPRNQGYEQALTTIIRRLRAHDAQIGPTIDRVLLDSAPARKRTVDERVLITAEETAGLSNEKLIALIRKRAKAWHQRPGTKGGNSTKQLRIEIRARSRQSILSTLQLRTWLPQSEGESGSPTALERLPYEMQRRVTPVQIDKAVASLLAGDDARNFSDSRDYDVVCPDGTRLPPKKVFGLALEAALGIEIFPGHFSGGWSQPSFELIEAAGYRISRKSARFVSPAEVDSEFDRVPVAAEDRTYIEGDKRMGAICGLSGAAAPAQPAISAPK